MKLFMEINPQLFDDCSHEYNEHQNNAEERDMARQEKWDKLQAQAERRKSSRPTVPDTTHESQQRLDALKLHDEASVAQQAAAVSSANVSIYQTQ